MKIKSGTVVALVFAAIAGGGYLAKEVITDRLVMRETFSALAPGVVNVVGIDAGAGYRIIVANNMAQLVESSDDFQGKEGEDGEGTTSGAVKRRIPMRELLQSLQGNTQALSKFAMNINGMAENDDWPPVRIVWTAERVRKALDGDAATRAELERDLNVKLDGTPLSRLRLASYENGIILDFPVPITVSLKGKPTQLIARVQEPYKPNILKLVENDVKEKSEVTAATIAGYYQDEARKQIDSGQRENVAKVLEDRISKGRVKDLASKPERVLKSAMVIVNEAFVTQASAETYEDSEGKPAYALHINVNDEGRRRLWQYSRKNMGTQLLVVSAGIPIAAPRIRHELVDGRLTVTQMRDRVLVDQAVSLINSPSKK